MRENSKSQSRWYLLQLLNAQRNFIEAQLNTAGLTPRHKGSLGMSTSRLGMGRSVHAVGTPIILFDNNGLC